jgi:hypothetical protein
LLLPSGMPSVIHGADGQDGLQRGRNVNTVAAVVAGRSDDEHVLFGAGMNCFLEQRLGCSRDAELSAADVDDVGAVLESQQDCACQIELRAHH